jgi:UDP-N-acetyl-D-mannosaminuronate dehydrogenase
MRESPVPIFIQELRNLGAEVIWHDPLVNTFKNEYSSPLQIVDLGIICSKHSTIDLSLWSKEKVSVLDLSISSNTGFSKFF